jgi:hypothetical protein
VDCEHAAALDYVEQKITERYGGCTRHDGDVLPFLGVMMDFTEKGVVTFSMPAFVDEIVRNAEVATIADTPAGNNLFYIEETSPKLSKEASDAFHSETAKLLYLAKRTRVDILLPVSFLCTRVREPTEDDLRKLKRVHRYLAGTADLPLRLSISDDYLFTAYVDASYAVHEDMKSHSGMVYTAGGGTFLAKSTKQSVVSKSSTEAEVIAASDGCNDLLSLMEFINFQTGRQGKAVLFQDNTSAIHLEKNGKSSSNKTKHMKIRYFWVKDKVASGELEIQHLPTDSMWADMLTKPLQGELFKKFRACVLNLPATSPG